ncbi:MAG: hypothetical protein E2603_13595 [Achromobacter sp.]|nr:hypothetical protein [Achromobacter sp.]
MTDELREFVQYESQYQLQLFESTVPKQVQAYVAIAPVNVQQAYSAALAQPFRGRLLAEWAKSIEADRMVRIRDAIRIGYVEGQTVDEIVRRLRGTRAKGYSDGIIEIDRRNAESVVRTALSHTAGVTRDRFYEANTDLIKALEWVSTLDSRTTPECRVRDGLQYEPVTHKPVGHKVPWLSGPGRIHWGCRSTSVPVTKSWRELGIDIDEMDESTRASMDGQVPAQVSYGDWLTRQPARRQGGQLVQAQPAAAGALGQGFAVGQGALAFFQQHVQLLFQGGRHDPGAFGEQGGEVVDAALADGRAVFFEQRRALGERRSAEDTSEGEVHASGGSFTGWRERGRRECRCPV